MAREEPFGTETYLKFLREKIRAGLKERLMVVAESEVDFAVDQALKDLKGEIQTMVDQTKRELLVKVVVERKLDRER